MHFFMATVLPLAGVFAIKVLENMFDASKVIFLQKNRNVISGAMLCLAMLINYYVMKIIVASGTATLVTAAVAAGTGYMLAGKISAKLLHGVYVNIIMSDNREDIVNIHNMLTERHIKHIVEDTYNKDLTERTLSITAYPRTRNENLMIRQMLKDSSAKFGHVVVE